MRSALVLLMMLSACGSTRPIDRRTFPVEALSEPGPRLTLQQDVPDLGTEWLSRWITFEGFPAISSDRELIVVARRFHDGARAHPNLAIEAYRVSTGERVFELSLVAADAVWVDEKLPERPPREALAEVYDRFGEARAFLRSKRWTPLEVLSEAGWPEARGAFYHFTSDGGVGLRLREPELIVDIAIDPLAYIKDEPTWSAPATCDSASDCDCSHPAYLETAWIAGDIIFAEVAYAGTDLCWEPESRFVFERLPTPTTATPSGWRRQPRDAADLANLRFVWEGLDLPPADPSPSDRERALRFLTWWERRAPDAPEVKAAQKLLRW